MVNASHGEIHHMCGRIISRPKKALFLLQTFDLNDTKPHNIMLLVVRFRILQI
jgi:hypothetical protein